MVLSEFEVAVPASSAPCTSTISSRVRAVPTVTASMNCRIAASRSLREDAREFGGERPVDSAATSGPIDVANKRIVSGVVQKLIGQQLDLHVDQARYPLRIIDRALREFPGLREFAHRRDPDCSTDQCRVSKRARLQRGPHWM